MRIIVVKQVCKRGSYRKNEVIFKVGLNYWMLVVVKMFYKCDLWVSCEGVMEVVG